MDESYLRRAAPYVEFNPVRAKLCRVPWRWRWSSAAAHIAGRDDALVRVEALLERVKDWRAFLMEALPPEEAEVLRRHERTGRPLGEAGFVDRIERLLGRVVHPAKRGPKPKPGKRKKRA
jgi:putative transposase